jgi:hypothetical protein
VVGVAEDRRARRRVVAADALEHARPVVQAVREDVDLRVLPRDELAVHPDELGLLHGPLLVQVGEHGGGRPRRCSPARRGHGCAGRRPAPDRRPTLPPGPRPPCPARGAAGAPRRGPSPAGWPIPSRRCPGAEPWTGSNTPGRPPPERRAGQHPDRARDHGRDVAEDVAEHVLGDDHVEVRRVGHELHRGVVDEQVVERDLGEVGGVDAVDRRAPQARGLRGRWPCPRW